MTLPFLELTGDTGAQGRRHGRSLRDDIARNVATYFRRFEVEAGVSAATVRERAAAYGTYLEAAHPQYAAGVLGIAEGAGIDTQDILALNARYEILYSALARERLGDGCTAFALEGNRTLSGHLLMGQNWDWIPDVRGAVVRYPAGGVTVLAFTEAGIFGGKIGLNSAGVGLAINGMTSTNDDWAPAGLPFHARCFDVLRAATREEAVVAITRGARPCSANFVIARAGEGALDIEAAPGATCATPSWNGALVHANHFLHADAMGVREAPYERRPFSVHRQARLQALLEEPMDVSRLQAALRDHDGYPDSVCRHPSSNEPAVRPYETVTSAILDLGERSMWLTAGPPCGAEYVRYDLDAGARGRSTSTPARKYDDAPSRVMRPRGEARRGRIP